MLKNKKLLDAGDVWRIAAEAIHTPDFRAKYFAALDFAIRDKKLSILDTATGTGFPTIDLYNGGFKNIEASDADQTSVEMLKAYFQSVGISIPVSEGKWQELSKKISKKYDVLVNLDNSVVYMDGWTEGGAFASGSVEVFKRMSLVFRNFYEVLNEDGFAIMGLSKHYHTGTKDYSLSLPFSKDGKKIDIDWFGEINWETRENKWTVKVKGEDFEGEFLKRSYGITKEEMASLMRDVGFKKVHILEPDSTRDNFIIGLKSGRV